jgi:hypothetical protein
MLSMALGGSYLHDTPRNTASERDCQSCHRLMPHSTSEDEDDLATSSPASTSDRDGGRGNQR